MDNSWKHIFVTIAVAIGTAIVTFLSTYYTVTSNYVIQLRELAYKSAIEEWKTKIQEHKEISNKFGVSFSAFDSDFSLYIVKHLQIAAYVNHFNMNISDEEAKDIFRLIENEIKIQDEKVKNLNLEIQKLEETIQNDIYKNNSTGTNNNVIQ